MNVQEHGYLIDFSRGLEINGVRMDIGYLYDWRTKYLGRKVDIEKYGQYFDHNGWYFETDDYMDRGVDCNLKIIRNEEDIITEVKTYKLQGSDSPRPTNKYLRLNSADVKAFSERLDAVTFDPVPEEMQKLIKSWQEEPVLNEYFHITKCGSAAVTVEDSNGDLISVKYKTVEDILSLSHTFVDILYDKETLSSFPKIVKPETADVLLALLTRHDYSSYALLPQLMRDTELRKVAVTAENGYAELLDAVYAGDKEKAKTAARYAPVFWVSKEQDPPLVVAVRQDDLEMVRLLLESGAPVTDQYREPAILIAVQKHNMPIIELLSQYDCFTDRHIIEKVQDEIIRQKTFNIFCILSSVMYAKRIAALEPKEIGYIDDDLIVHLIHVDGACINWPREMVEKVYREDRETCKKMVYQGCDDDTIVFFMQQKDMELFKLSLKRFFTPYSSRVRFFKEVFDCGKEWFDALVDHLLSLVSGDSNDWLILNSFIMSFNFKLNIYVNENCLSIDEKAKYNEWIKKVEEKKIEAIRYSKENS